MEQPNRVIFDGGSFLCGCLAVAVWYEHVSSWALLIIAGQIAARLFIPDMHKPLFNFGRKDGRWFFNWRP